MPDIFSIMLKDTTAEHKAHLFDLNCKICTGGTISPNIKSHIPLKENSGAKSTFGLIKHWYLVNCSLRFVFMIIECKEFYLSVQC